MGRQRTAYEAAWPRAAVARAMLDEIRTREEDAWQRLILACDAARQARVHHQPDAGAASRAYKDAAGVFEVWRVLLASATRAHQAASRRSSAAWRQWRAAA